MLKKLLDPEKLLIWTDTPTNKPRVIEYLSTVPPSFFMSILTIYPAYICSTIAPQQTGYTAFEQQNNVTSATYG